MPGLRRRWASAVCRCDLLVVYRSAASSDVLCFVDSFAVIAVIFLVAASVVVVAVLACVEMVMVFTVIFVSLLLLLSLLGLEK